MPKLFNSTNAFTTLSKDPQGVCIGECVMFAKISLNEGGCTKGQIGKIESNGIAAHALYNLRKGTYQSLEKVLSLHGLRVQEQVDKDFTPITLAGLLDKNYKGKVVLIGVGRGKDPDHCVAAWVKDNSQYDYFDPNDGLYRESNAADFAKAMTTNFSAQRISAMSMLVLSNG